LDIAKNNPVDFIIDGYTILKKKMSSQLFKMKIMNSQKE
jgi:hypothetical protein